MGKSKFRKFEDFRDDANSDASRVGALHAFGFGANGETFERADEIAAVLRKRLTKSTIGRELTDKINDDTVEKLLAFLCKDFKNLINTIKEKDVVYTMLDRITLGLVTHEEIDSYLKKYGYDINQKTDRKKIYEIFTEALYFFDNHVYPYQKPKHKIPKELREPFKIGETDKTFNKDAIYNVFQSSAGMKMKRNIPFACATLRISYVIWYMEHEYRIRLLDRAYEACEESKAKIIANPELMKLIVAIKSRIKDRKGTIGKLLHKPKNRADEVLDHQGVRVLVRTPADAIKIIHMLFFDHENSIFLDTTIRVDDTKNLLFKGKNKLSTTDIRLLIEDALKDPNKADAVFAKLGSDTSFEQTDEDSSDEDQSRKSNINSSSAYRAIKIIFEHVIKDKDGNSTLFPIELQVIDQNSQVNNAVSAPHSSYKETQGTAIAKRIMGNNLLELWNKTKGLGVSHGQNRRKIASQ